MMEGIPKQRNGDDCGLAVCMNARAIVFNSQENITPTKSFNWGYELTEESEELRKRLATELVMNKLLDN